jgi:hypothetical protein
MDIIKIYEDVALSNYDLIQLLDGKANIVIYPQLAKYETIEQVLGPTGACFLLFEAKPKYGHWVCLMKRGNVIEFFNPYGGLLTGWPDNSLKSIPMKFRKESGQVLPLLSLLLLDSPYELEYNEFQFQKHSKNIKTCGRHSAVRLLLKNLDIYQYKAFLDSMCKETNLNYDELVTFLTF